MQQHDILRELQQIPEEYWTDVYALIHDFRIKLNQQLDQPRQPGLLQGVLGDAFFEALPEEELKRWE